MDYIWDHAGKLDDVIDDFFEEVKSGSDRSVSIVLAALVEDNLTDFIRSRLVKDDELQSRFFGPGGVLGDFATKIHTAYLLGFISKAAWKELDTIRRIRNDFAHKLKTSKFTSQSVQARCAQLSLYKHLQVTIRVINADGSEGREIGGSFENSDSSAPRYQYINACRFFVLMLSNALAHKHKTPKPII